VLLSAGFKPAFPAKREWRNRQTRTVQVRVPERVWGFNSPLAHKCDVFRHRGRMSRNIEDRHPSLG
jgi:hypothetical protein